MTLLHQASEFHSNANGQRAYRQANKWLAELQEGINDLLWQQQAERHYMGMLKCGHKLGIEGSLLLNLVTTEYDFAEDYYRGQG